MWFYVVHNYLAFFISSPWKSVCKLARQVGIYIWKEEFLLQNILYEQVIDVRIISEEGW